MFPRFSSSIEELEIEEESAGGDDEEPFEIRSIADLCELFQAGRDFEIRSPVSAFKVFSTEDL